MYSDELFEHFKYPEHKKKISNPSFKSNKDNPSCGDIVSMEGIIADNIILDVGFDGKGCVISQAAASMLSGYARGKTSAEILALRADTIQKLLNLSLGPNRLKCALLSLEVLQKGIELHQSSLAKD